MELEGIYPKALSKDFNTVYNGHYGIGGEKLRAIFNFLEINGVRGMDAAQSLQAIFSHLFEDVTFVDRFYKNYSDKEVTLRESVLKTLEQRIYLLQRVLEAHPVKNDLALFDALLYVSVADFHPREGFRNVADKDLTHRIVQMQKTFREAAERTKERDEEAAWKEQDDDEDAPKPLMQSSIPKYGRNEIVVLPWENPVEVLQHLNAMKEDSYQNAKQKAELGSFDEFGEVPLYAYHIIHHGSGNPYILLNLYQRGIEFLEFEVVAPKFGDKNELKGARTKNFLIHLRQALDGTLTVRFGERFSKMAIERFEQPLKQLRGHLERCSNVRELFKDSESLRELNTILTAVGVEEFHPPEP